MLSFVAASALALGTSGPVQAPPAQTQAQTPEQKFEKELNDDRELGRKAAEYYDTQYPPSKDAAAVARVRRIGAALALIANATPVEKLWGDKRHATFQYTFKVVESEDVNAFSLPGGTIYVFDGLVKFCESDDELAGVLAHEIAHAEQRHIAQLRREQAKMERLTLPLILAAILTGGAALGPVAAGTGLVGTAITNGWSQKAETSSDFAAYQYLGRSTFEPTGLLTFMERLRLQEFNQTQGRDLGIFRTHPPSRVRAERITGYMKAGGTAPRRSLVTRSFRTTVRTDESGTIRLHFGSSPLFAVGGKDAPARAEKLAERFNAFFDGVPEPYEVRENEDEIRGGNRVLVKFTPEDAAVAGMPVEKLTQTAARNIRGSIMGLAYHLWDER